MAAGAYLGNKSGSIVVPAPADKKTNKEKIKVEVDNLGLVGEG